MHLKTMISRIFNGLQKPYRFIVYIYIFFCSLAANAQIYEMSDSRIVLGGSLLMNTNRLGVLPGFNLRYAWRNNNGDESALALYYFAPAQFSDTFTATAYRTGLTYPVQHVTTNYTYKHMALMYQYNYYFLETEYYDTYGFFLSGAGGIIIYKVAHEGEYDANKYATTYSYRKGSFSPIIQAQFGSHYQLGQNFRAIGELGPYLFFNPDIRNRGDGSGLRFGFNLSLGVSIGF
jgi:hypothetical protein